MEISSLKKYSYKQLMSYYLSKCDVLLLTQYSEIPKYKNKKIQDFIFNKNSDYKKRLLIKNPNYLIKKIKKIYNNDLEIYKIIDVDSFIKNCPNLADDPRSIEAIIEGNIEFALNNYVYNSKFEYIQKRYKKYLIEKRKVPYEGNGKKYLLSKMGTRKVYHIKYSFKLSQELKKWALEAAHSIEEFGFPNNPDEVMLFQNGYCKMLIKGCTSSCSIYIDDKEEYEYLRSIGISFWEEELEIDEDKEWRSYDSIIQAQK